LGKIFSIFPQGTPDIPCQVHGEILHPAHQRQPKRVLSPHKSGGGYFASGAGPAVSVVANWRCMHGS